MSSARRSRIRGLFAATFALLAGCAQLPVRPELPAESALPPALATELDRRVAPLEDARPGQSGFYLVTVPHEAYALRARTAQLAGRSLDVQTFIWWDDLTGRQLAGEILEAADRGVRVRLLVDDVNARARKYAFAALAAHPNIAVRMFNPFASRRGKASMVAEVMGDFSRINRRMHNKSWIVDNRIALIGGRNLGDEYFGIGGEFNFADLDIAMAGPIVRDVSASFDAYWNSSGAYPVEVLSPRAARPAGLDALRDTLRRSGEAFGHHELAAELREHEGVEWLQAGKWPMQWTDQFRFVADDPAKSDGGGRRGRGSNVHAALLPAIEAAREDVAIISPYLVPRDGGTRLLVGLAREGRRVRVLTNSLAATDVAAVHGGYMRYRPVLLRGGVRIWEYKPTAEGVARQEPLGSSSASLHSKAVVIDGRRVFVGSNNLDPRSTSLNSEVGVFVDSIALARQLTELFEAEIAPQRAWEVTLEEGFLSWQDDERRWGREPVASPGRRFVAWLARWLPPVRSYL
jgi:cardiolipin synthase C